MAERTKAATTSANAFLFQTLVGFYLAARCGGAVLLSSLVMTGRVMRENKQIAKMFGQERLRKFVQ